MKTACASADMVLSLVQARFALTVRPMTQVVAWRSCSSLDGLPATAASLLSTVHQIRGCPSCYDSTERASHLRAIGSMNKATFSGHGTTSITFWRLAGLYS